MNCALEMKSVVEAFNADPKMMRLCDVLLLECEEEWTRDYAIVMLTLLEEPPEDEFSERNYDAIREAAISFIQKKLSAKKVTRVDRWATKPAQPKDGYALVVNGSYWGFQNEIEVYSVAWSKRSRARLKKEWKKVKGAE